MLSQETELIQNTEQKEKEQLSLSGVCSAFENFAQQFQNIKEQENPGLLSNIMINEELESSDGGRAEINVWRRPEIDTSGRLTPRGSIILKGPDLRREGIENVAYLFGWRHDGIHSQTHVIRKNTLRIGEEEASKKELSNQDSQELGKVNALIKELSGKFPPATIIRNK